MKKIEISKDKVCQLYNEGKSAIKIGEILYCSETTIFKILKEKGISSRIPGNPGKYIFKNERFFEKIDSEEKAYFLGLIFADGSLNDKLKTLQISLVSEDSNVLELFNSLIYKNRPIRTITHKNIKHRDQNQVTVTSKLFYNDLLKYNLSQNKSRYGKWVNIELIPQNLRIHFIRGYMDGDGCIYIHKVKKAPLLTFNGHTNFIVELQKIIKQNIKSKGNISIRNEETNYTSCLCYGGPIQVKRILDWIYKGSNIFLDRKYQKYKIL